MVLGCGRWGSFIADYLAEIGHRVTLYGRASSRRLQSLVQTRKNEYLTLPDSVRLTSDLGELAGAETVIISIAAQQLRSFCRELCGLIAPGIPIVLCMKGIEETTGKRLSQVVREEIGEKNPVAVWLGPGHVQDFLAGIPNCMVIDSDSPEWTRTLVDRFSGGVIRFYYGEDLIGNEIGAAAKNVIGIAAGVLDGLHLHALKGALMSRGPHEISRLICAMGGSPFSAYGLCHLGDYEATLFSKHSHNRGYGEAFTQGQPYPYLAEGIYTARAIQRLSETYQVEMPICRAVYQMIEEIDSPEKIVSDLFLRKVKKEFE